VFVPLLCPKYFTRKKSQVTETELSQKIFFRVCSISVSKILCQKGISGHKNWTLTKNLCLFHFCVQNTLPERNLRSQKLNSHKKSFSVFVPFLCPKYFAKKEFRVTKTELSQKILCQFRFCDLIFLLLILIRSCCKIVKTDQIVMPAHAGISFFTRLKYQFRKRFLHSQEWQHFFWFWFLQQKSISEIS